METEAGVLFCIVLVLGVVPLVLEAVIEVEVFSLVELEVVVVVVCRSCFFSCSS